MTLYDDAGGVVCNGDGVRQVYTKNVTIEDPSVCKGGEPEPGPGPDEPVPPDTPACGSDEFTCYSGACIPNAWVCDGTYSDCSSGEDEDAALCGGAGGTGGGDGSGSGGTQACTAGEFTCGSGACIPDAWVCDGAYTDCSDGSDEAGCPATEPPADNCGGIDYAGTCQGNVATWCQDGDLQSVDCTASGQTCSYVDASTGYYCQ